MADRKISDLTALTTPAAGDYLPIIDISEPLAANKNKRITIEELLRGAPDGTAAAPSFAFESDPDTGLYSTGANAVAISTGGTGRLFINSSGNVGIATSTTPGKATIGVGDGADDGLSLYYNGGGTNETVAEFHANTTTGQVTLGGTAATYFTTLFSGGSERLRITTAGQIQSAGLGSAASPALSFTTDTNTGIYSPGADQVAISTNGTGRLFIAADGKIGFNVSSPTQAQLVVASSAGANTAFFTDGTNSSIKFLHGGGGAVITTEPGQYLGFGTSDAERMRLDSSGRLGLGTSSPSRRLHVSVSGTGNVATFESDGGPNLAFVGTEASGRTYLIGEGLTAAGLFQIYDNNASAARLTINSSGSVGIGTTSPGELLHVVNPTTTAEFRISGGTTAAAYSQIGFYGSTTRNAEISANSAFLNLDHVNSGVVRVSTGGFERARITSDGKLLVGTSSDSGGALLQVNGNRVRIATAKTPASASDTGTAGEICWDADYIYVCTATNTWKRSAISTW
jgi:hypothetical protein